MGRITPALVVLAATMLGPAGGSVAASPPEVIIRDVEFAFRDAMELWAYRAFWRLWEVSTSTSRFSMSQSEFADVMERGNARPAVGRRIEDLRITATSPHTAAVLARIGLEDPRTNTTRSLVRSFLFYYEDGRWRPQLSDFLGLSLYSFPFEPSVRPGILIAPCCPITLVPPKRSIIRSVAPCCSPRMPSPDAQMIVPRR